MIIENFNVFFSESFENMCIDNFDLVGNQIGM